MKLTLLNSHSEFCRPKCKKDDEIAFFIYFFITNNKRIGAAAKIEAGGDEQHVIYFTWPYIHIILTDTAERPPPFCVWPVGVL